MKGIVTKNRFCEIEFLAPPSDLQKRFGYRCKQICEQTEARLKQVGRFDRLFSLLLHRAFTGDLTASWARDLYERATPRDGAVEDAFGRERISGSPAVGKQQSSLKFRCHWWSGHVLQAAC